MFAKISFISVIYDMIETFCFPNNKRKEITKNIWLISFILIIFLPVQILRINSVRGIEISGSYLRKNKVSLDFL